MKTKIDMTPRQASMALQLAKIIGLLEPSLRNEIYVYYKEEAWHPVGYLEFNPFYNRAQWADVILWVFSNAYEIGIEEEFFAEGPVAIMAATLESAAIATGWKETTHQE